MPERCWTFADQKIRELRAKIKLAEDGDYKGNPAVMRDSLDRWLAIGMEVFLGTHADNMADMARKNRARNAFAA